MNAPVLCTNGVSCRLSARFTLHVADLVVGPGFTVVSGANGSGKSTLLRLMATVLAPTTGTLTLGGTELGSGDALVAHRRRLGYAPQDDSTPPRLTVFDHVDLVAVMRELGSSPRDRRGAVAAALHGRELTDLAAERCGKLSGGQRRRVALAAALAGAPSMLVLDEPDAHLDDHHRALLLEHLRDRARRQHCSIVVSSHDRDWMSELVADPTIPTQTVSVVDGVATAG